MEWRECAICGWQSPLSLHHVSKHPRDDVRGNLVMVCGSGTTGCHGRLEAHDRMTSWLLGQYILAERPDVVEYLIWRKGEESAKEWIRSQLSSELV
jgi:hypothetical protein